MGRKHAVIGLSLFLTLAVLGCKKDTKVYVECLTSAQGANCTLTHQQGKDAAGVCWDVKVTCANGAVVTGNGCQNVMPEGKTSLIIPENQFKGGKCDKMAGVAVENIKVGPVLSATPAAQQAPPVAADEYLVIPQTSVELKAAPGWVRRNDGDWGIMASPDKQALLAFIMFDRPGESTAKLGQVATVLGTSNIKWGSPKSITLGPDAFPAQVADGTCSFPSGEGEISYATINPGTPQQVLVVYTVKKGAPKAVEEQAVAVLKSMRKKR